MGCVSLCCSLTASEQTNGRVAGSIQPVFAPRYAFRARHTQNVRRHSQRPKRHTPCPGWDDGLLTVVAVAVACEMFINNIQVHHPAEHVSSARTHGRDTPTARDWFSFSFGPFGYAIGGANKSPRLFAIPVPMCSTTTTTAVYHARMMRARVICA